MLQRGAAMPLPSPAARLGPVSREGAPRLAIFSPHPDDECLIGALPLRLQQEAGWEIHNLAVTLGSRRDRQAARWQELEAACGVLGFHLHRLAERGLERIRPDVRETDPEHWQQCVDACVRWLLEVKPKALICHHIDDAQPTHKGTCLLAQDAVAAMPQALRPQVIYCEYWASLANPNLLVELSGSHAALLMQALMQHVGEVQRHPYHLSFSAWLMDSLRRGAEQVNPPGSAMPAMRLASLYEIKGAQKRLLPASEKASLV